MSTRHDTTIERVESGEAESLGDRPADDGSGGEATELPLDTVFDIIRNERRRLVVKYLEDVESRTTLSDLTEHIAAIENDTTVDALSAQQRKRVYVGLYQCHLPKMADAGVLEFDKDRGVVRRGPNAGQLDPYLAVTQEPDAALADRWYRLLAGVAVVGYLLAVVGGSTGQVVGGVLVFSTVAVLGFIAVRERLDHTD